MHKSREAIDQQQAAEREALIAERDALDDKMKHTDFIDPKDLRRVDEITSLLLSGGTTTEIRLKTGKMHKSKRVTSFTRDRR